MAVKGSQRGHVTPELERAIQLTEQQQFLKLASDLGRIKQETTNEYIKKNLLRSGPFLTALVERQVEAITRHAETTVDSYVRLASAAGLVTNADTQEHLRRRLDRFLSNRGFLDSLADQAKRVRIPHEAFVEQGERQLGAIRSKARLRLDQALAERALAPPAAAPAPVQAPAQRPSWLPRWLTWVWEERRWLFSGIGRTILIALVLALSALWASRRQIQPLGSATPGITTTTTTLSPQRPWLLLEDYAVVDWQPAKKTIRFTVRNSGATPALKTRFRSGAYSRPSCASDSEIEAALDQEIQYSSVAIVAAGDDLKHLKRIDDVLTKDTMDQISTGTLNAYVVGRVSYQDTIDGQYVTRFCIQYDPRAEQPGRWVYCECYNRAE